MHAMPILVVILCLMAIAYRYYSAFLATKVAVLDASRQTPAYRFNDGQNYHPTNKWVLFGHHFAAISGAGPLIGPVLAAQFGYMPGLMWIVIGVCLAGAVQDFLALAASIRYGGKSIAQIAWQELGKTAGTAAMAAIIFILVVALAGLGKVVVKALGGEEVRYPAGSVIALPAGRNFEAVGHDNGKVDYTFPAHSRLFWGERYERSMEFSESLTLRAKGDLESPPRTFRQPLTRPELGYSNSANLSYGYSDPRALGATLPTTTTTNPNISAAMFLLLRTQEIASDVYTVPATQPSYRDTYAGDTRLEAFVIPSDAVRLVTGSSWGTFTIACTIPIALFTGLYMYKIRKGRVVEASLIGAVLTLFATFAGGWVSQQPFGQFFSLKDTSVIWCMAAYGFVASVLPVWVLLCPRDYLSSFLKIGTIGILVGGVLIANPELHAPAFNTVFFAGGPTVGGQIFPFLFITVMCGAISGFHALVSSGTTPKMIKSEGDARTIGYGAMLIEGLVGVVAMIAAAALPTNDYYAMNTDLAKVPVFQERILQVGGGGGIEHLNPAAAAQDNLPRYEALTRESLRGRTGGAVTLAVGMAEIFDQALTRFATGSQSTMQAMWKYWYHFAIMFEALFILTTIDTGTRVGRFVIQELLGRFWPHFGKTDWLPSTLISTALMVGGWGYLIQANSMAAIWPMFGISNQLLAVIALSIISVWLVREGRSRYLWVTVIPAAVVLTTTSTAAAEMLFGQIRNITTQLQAPPGARNLTTLTNAAVTSALIIAIVSCSIVVIISSALTIVFNKPSTAPADGDAVPSTTDIGD